MIEQYGSHATSFELDCITCHYDLYLNEEILCNSKSVLSYMEFEFKILHNYSMFVKISRLIFFFFFFCRPHLTNLTTYYNVTDFSIYNNAVNNDLLSVMTTFAIYYIGNFVYLLYVVPFYL